MDEQWIFTSRFSGYPRYADRFWYNLDKTSLSTNPNPLPGIFIAFIDNIEGEFQMNVHLPCPVWTMTTAPLGIRPCSSSQASRSSSCSTLSKPRACTLLKQEWILELTNSLKNGYIVQLGSPAHLRCHVNLDTGSYQTWNRDLLRLKCIELGIRQDCLKLRRVICNRWETDMNDVMKSLNITIHKWHDMVKSKRYPMGITHPPLSLGEMSRRIQVSAAAYQRRRQSKKAFLNTQRNPECY